MVSHYSPLVFYMKFFEAKGFPVLDIVIPCEFTATRRDKSENSQTINKYMNVFLFEDTIDFLLNSTRNTPEISRLIHT